MNNQDIIALGFLILGGLFVVTLLKNLWTVITNDWTSEKLSLVNLIKIFKATIFSLLLFIFFVAYILPRLQ